MWTPPLLIASFHLSGHTFRLVSLESSGLKSVLGFVKFAFGSERINTVARRYGIYLWVARTISHEWGFWNERMFLQQKQTAHLWATVWCSFYYINERFARSGRTYTIHTNIQDLYHSAYQFYEQIRSQQNMFIDKLYMYSNSSFIVGWMNWRMMKEMINGFLNSQARW